MKLLRVIASGFKNLQDNTDINLVAQSKKTSEDKEYELVNIAEELYVYSTAAFIGNFSIDNKYYAYDGEKKRIFFWQDGMIYRYDTELSAVSTFGNKATFVNQSIYQKKYYKTKFIEIFDDV